MKTFYDLTEEEKLTLTSEQVQYYAKIDCASRGIILPQKPINKLKEVVAPSQKYYQVGYESFVFETDKEAQDYIDAKSKALQVKTIGNNYDSKNQYVSERHSDYKEIKSTILYSKEEAADLKSVLEYNAETSKEWSEYDKALVEYNKIERFIWDEIEEIQYKNSRIAYYDKVYNDYLELAQNDENMAWAFFDKAYRTLSVGELDREIIDEMLNRPTIVESDEKSN